jgi:hypothetical protein
MNICFPIVTKYLRVLRFFNVCFIGGKEYIEIQIKEVSWDLSNTGCPYVKT